MREIDDAQARFRRLHRVLLGVSTFFFAYLVIEGFLFLPFLLFRYGGQ